MYSLDTNTNVALDRQSERVRAVQAYGVSQKSQPATASWPGGDGRPNGLPAGLTSVVLLLTGLLVARA